jgi:signal transduction histidine kinase
MAAVLGYSEMLLDPSLTQAERDHALHAIRRDGAHLLQIINDVLDLSISPARAAS